jgi:hypothetical protein
MTDHEPTTVSRTIAPDRHPAGEWISRGVWWLLPILGLAAWLRTHEIATVGLQCDESFVQRMVEYSWSEMFERIARDTHPPLFFVVDKLWVGVFGDGIATSRLLSALLGVSAVAGIYAFVREVGLDDAQSAQGRFREAELPGLLAAAMLATTPLQIFWSLQIRMYSLAVALTAWSGFFLIRAWNRPGFRNWTAYTISAILLSYSHYFGLFILACQYACSVPVLIRRTEGTWFERITPPAISACAVWFAWQPWIPSFMRQREQVERNFYLPAPSWEVLASLLHEVWIDFGAKPSRLIGALILQGLFITVMLLPLRKRPADVFIALGAVLPAAMVFGMSAVSRSLLNGRYFLPMQVFWIAAIAIVVCRFWWPLRCLAITLLAMGFWSSCHAHYANRAAQARLPGMRAAVRLIDDARNGDPVVVSNPMLHSSAISYATHRENLYLYQPPQGYPFFMCTAVIRDEEYLDRRRIEALDSGFLWTLDSTGWLGSVPVAGPWRLVREVPFDEWYAGLVVRLYQRETASAPADQQSGSRPRPALNRKPADEIDDPTIP